jgi:hypothetical protein
MASPYETVGEDLSGAGDHHHNRRALLDRLSDGLEVVESHVSGFTPAMAAHMGPGVVGLAWFCDGAPLGAKLDRRWYP